MRIAGISARTIRLVFASAAFLCAVAWQYGISPEGRHPLDEQLRDFFIRLSVTGSAEERIAIVDIDESSLAKVGAWPWPRTVLADLVERLATEYAAAGIGLDMVFPEPADPAGDARMASLVHNVPLVMAVAFDYVHRSPRLAQGVPGNGYMPFAFSGAIEATGFIGNHTVLGSHACAGNIGLVPDNDGAVRRLPWATRMDGQVFPSLAVALFARCSESVRPIPSEAGTFRRLRYPRSLDAYTVIPAAAILDGSVPVDLIRDRLVLIGSSALGLADLVTTPLSISTPGVFVHASLLTEVLDQVEGKAPRHLPVDLITTTWLAVTTFLLAWLLSLLSPALSVLLLGVTAMVWLAFASVLVPAGGFSILAPWAGYAVLSVLALPYEWWLARRYSRQLKGLLSHYVSPSVLDRLLAQTGGEPLEPRLCEVSVLIADMEGYTALTSTLSLDEAAQMTRGFLEAITGPVLDSEGTLDKYTGDGMVAFWGAPIDCPDHADRAIGTGARILRAVADFNRASAQSGLPAVRVRIGIESGVALAGDLGTSFRSTYTAVGDCINFAARLEEAAKNLPADIIVGPETRRLARRSPLRPLGIVAVRGTEQEMAVFTIAGDGLALS